MKGVERRETFLLELGKAGNYTFSNSVNLGLIELSVLKKIFKYSKVFGLFTE